jgi:hypothetical protein
MGQKLKICQNYLEFGLSESLFLFLLIAHQPIVYIVVEIIALAFFGGEFVPIGRFDDSIVNLDFYFVVFVI